MVSPTRQTGLVFLLIALAVGTVAGRWLPHQPNVATVGALSLVAGYYLTGHSRWLIPFGALLISDAAIGFYQLPIMAAVYVSYGGVIWLGGLNRRLTGRWPLVGRIGALAGTSAAGSLLFFLVTNATVVWFGSLYPQTISGLLTSYYLALPFWRNSLASDLFYSIVFTLTVEGGIRIISTVSQLTRRFTTRSTV